MNIIKVDCLPLSIFVGYERENDARGVTFDYSAWAEQYGDGVLQLLVQRPGDADPYPVVLTAGENNTAVWLLSATDTAVKGQLEIQLIFTVGSVVAKTAVLPVLVDRSLAAGATPPDPYETWLETLTQLAVQILHTTQPPEIRDGYWYIFDPDTGEYINSGVKAEGEDGVGITGAQLNADYTLTLTFSDGTSYTTPSIRGAQGEPGPTPQLSIGTVTTGAAGSSAAVEISGTPGAPVLNFTIPRGDTGEVSEAELQAALLDKADVITDTASGAIASFPDGAAAPVKALTVAVDPVQDLNGYDNPWPAGGGKNLLDPSQRTTTAYNAYFYKNTGFLLKANQAYTLTAYSSEKASGIYFKSYPENETLLVEYNAKTATYTPTEDVTAWFDVYYATAPTEGTANINVQLELESTSTDFAPYSNICPISGRTGATVQRTGKNLCDSAAFESGLLATAIGSNINAVTSTTRYAHSGIMPAKSALAVTVKTLDLSKIEYASIVAYVGDKVAWTAAQSFSSSVMSKTWTIPANTYEKLRINIGAPSGVTADASNAEIQVEIGSATAYEPYQGETYSITFPTEAGTVYGGTLDVTQGKLTVDRAMVTVDGTYVGNVYASPWSYVTVSASAFPGIKSGTITDLTAPDILVSDQFTPYRYTSASGHPNTFYFSGGTLYLREPTAIDTTSKATAQASLNANPVSVVYPLATPIVYDLDPVTVSTLLGVNNFWSDAGDVSVEYRADTKLYIEKKITAAIAAALNS